MFNLDSLSFIQFIWLWFENQSLNMLKHDIFYFVFYDMGFNRNLSLMIQHSFKNRIDQRVGLGSSSWFYDSIGVGSMVEPMTL